MEQTENVYAKGCPADAIREFIEKIISLQRSLEGKGKHIPERIELSPKCIEYLLNSKLVDAIGAGETGNEIEFYWERTDALPALEVRTKREENGKFILTYIKEEKSAEKPEFLWEENNDMSKKGTIVVSKKDDALEEICDMDR